MLKTGIFLLYIARLYKESAAAGMSKWRLIRVEKPAS
jgi:hypothetical protein